MTSSGRTVVLLLFTAVLLLLMSYKRPRITPILPFPVKQPRFSTRFTPISTPIPPSQVKQQLRFSTRVTPISTQLSPVEAWEAAYLALHPDVAGAVAAGDWDSGLAHYFAEGMKEKRTAPPLDERLSSFFFNSSRRYAETAHEWWSKEVEREYLEHNPDIAKAVASGTMKSGFYHFTTDGWREKRKVVGPKLRYSATLTPRPQHHALTSIQSTLDCWAEGTWTMPSPPHTGDAALAPWVWSPVYRPGCPVLPILGGPIPPSAGFCGAYGGGTRLLLIGDSITRAVFRATEAAAAADAEAGGVLAAPHLLSTGCGTGCIAFSACNGNAEVVFIWWNAFRAFPSQAKIQTANPTHVIINTGAWYVPDPEFVAALSDAVAKVTAYLPSASVALRNTAHGHEDCGRETAPWRALPQGGDYTAYLARLPHFWSSFPRQNELLRRIAASAGVALIDYAGPAVLRPDHYRRTPSGAPDCLHYNVSLPGSVPHTWVRLNAGWLALTKRQLTP